MIKMWIFMNMWSRSTYKRLRKRSNSFPVHKKLVWPTDLPKTEEEIFNSSQPRGVCSGSQLCVAIDPDLTFKVKCALYYLLGDQKFYWNFGKRCQFDIVFKNYLNKKLYERHFHNYICMFWSVLCVNWRVMTLVDVKLSLASVSLCNWVLKLGLVLWVFTVVNVWKGAINVFNKGSSLFSWLFAVWMLMEISKLVFNTNVLYVCKCEYVFFWIDIGPSRVGSHSGWLVPG